ncbi:MAG: MotA/TolQ/ExbB proton channel family protein, partial [Planctomycetota bacterium]
MLKILVDGGYMMIPLMFCSVLAVGVVIDRGLAFMRYARVDTRSLRAQVMQMLREGRVQEAALLCAQTPGPVAAVLLAGIQAYAKHLGRVGEGEVAATVKTTMEEFSVHALSAVEKRFGVLSTIGNAAPLLGMTGTVVGMIASFDALQQQAGDVGVVAGGISTALITTAAGLMIA